jgi:hypothetical protein
MPVPRWASRDIPQDQLRRQKSIIVGQSPTGFQFCVSHLNPTNPDLVATPEHLIEAVRRLGEMDPHFMAVKMPRFVCGDYDLYRDFCHRLQTLDASGARSAESALNELALHVQSRQDLPRPTDYIVDIKVHIYRPLQGIVKALYGYYGFSAATQTREQLDALVKTDHMSKEVNAWFKGAFDEMGRMRISGHLTTMSEEHAYFVRKLTAAEEQAERRHAQKPEVGYVGGLECDNAQKRLIESLLTRVHTAMNLAATFVNEKRRTRNFSEGFFKVNPFKTDRPDSFSPGTFRFVNPPGL